MKWLNKKKRRFLKDLILIGTAITAMLNIISKIIEIIKALH